MGGIGVMFEDELNAAAAQANEAVRRAMPNVDLGIGFQQPEWMRQAQAKWQAQIDQVNSQLAAINPAAPAAAAGVGVLALAALLTGLYYASCELGWNEPNEAGSSSQNSEGGSSKDSEGSSSRESNGSSSNGSSKETEQTEEQVEEPAQADAEAEQPAN